MKKFLNLFVSLFMIGVLAGCGNSGSKEPVAPPPTDDGTQQTEAPEEPEEPVIKEAINVGFVIRTLDSPYYVGLAEAIEAQSKQEGWNCTILNSAGDTEKESQNMDTLITQNVDLIFLDSVIPDPAVPVINRAADAGIGVINLDSGVGEGARDITTVYSDNEQNGRKVGLAYATKIGKDEPIKSVILSGNKGSIAGEQRRTGIFCGIIESRLGVSEAEAWVLAKQFNEDLTNSGKAENVDAKFICAGQGWGDWTEDGGLVAAEDLITANKDLTVIIGENDQMLFGAMTALTNSNIEGVELVAGADGALRAYDLIKEGKYFATGENSPKKVAAKGMEIAKEILIDGKDMWSYDEITFTEAVAVTIDNVDQHYEFGF